LSRQKKKETVEEEYLGGEHGGHTPTDIHRDTHRDES
jgi:hypothetical protein